MSTRAYAVCGPLGLGPERAALSPKAKHTIDTRRFAGCFFIVQRRRETEARQGVRAAGMHEEAFRPSARKAIS